MNYLANPLFAPGAQDGHVAGGDIVFAQAIDKLNLLQPEFVVSVGDLIEGGKKADDKLAAEWKEFDSYVNKLTMPNPMMSGLR